MVWIAMPRWSNAWKARGMPAGARKWAEPSGSTATVPRTCLPGEALASPTRGVFACGVVLGRTCTTRRRFTTSSDPESRGQLV